MEATDDHFRQAMSKPASDTPAMSETERQVDKYLEAVMDEGFAHVTATEIKEDLYRIEMVRYVTLEEMTFS